MRNPLLPAALLTLAPALSAQFGCPPGGTGGLSFDGVNDRVNTGTWPSPWQHTIEAWVRIPPGSTGWGTIAGHIGNQGTFNCGTGYGLRVKGGKLIYDLDLASCGGAGTELTDSQTPKNTWVHYAGTFDGSAGRLYRDGVLLQSAGGASFGSYNRFTMGAQQQVLGSGWGAFFRGTVADVRLWNHARSQAQIQATLGVPLTGSEPGLLGYWPLDEGAGSSTADLAVAGGHPGTLAGGPQWLVTPTCLGTGCGTNPAGSLVHISGSPTLGKTWTLGVDNPLGTQAPGALAFLALGFIEPAGLPCGTLLPSGGMSGPGAPAELLVDTGSAGLTVLGPLVWAGAGTPAAFPLAIPNDPTIIGLKTWAQGLVVDPPGAVPFGLTSGLEASIGS